MGHSDDHGRNPQADDWQALAERYKRERDEARTKLAKAEEENARLRADNLKRQQQHGAMHSRALQVLQETHKDVKCRCTVECNSCGGRGVFRGAVDYDTCRSCGATGKISRWGDCPHNPDSLCIRIDTILDDPTSAAADEAQREMEAVYEAAREYRHYRYEHHDVLDSDGWRANKANAKLRDALAKVAARRDS